MKIAIVSDTHSRYANVRAALAAIKKRGVTMVLHCGDIEDGDTVRLFADLDAHFVFGNCDYDKADLRRAMVEIDATSHEHWGHLELEGRKLAFMHGDDKSLLHDVESSGEFNYLFHGHTHVATQRQSGPTRVINPGALHRAKPKTFIVLDMATDAIESIALSPSEETSR
jgi:putative phosphoesterase